MTDKKDEAPEINPLLWVREMLKVPKTRHNKFGDFNYRSAEDILAAVKPLCAEVDAILSLSDKIKIKDDRVYVRTRAIFIHPGFTMVKADGFAREPLTKKGMDESQITGTASSYALKRALGNLFLLDDTSDADDLPMADDDQIAEWRDRVDAKDIFWLYDLKNDNYPLYMALLRDGPGKGEKTKYRKLVGEYVHEAYTRCDEQAKALIAAAEKGDKDGIHEIVEELNGDMSMMKAGVWFCLPDRVKGQIRTLLEVDA